MRALPSHIQVSSPPRCDSTASRSLPPGPIVQPMGACQHAAAAAVAATRRWRQQARQREESSRRGRNCSRANLLWARVAQRRGRPAWRGGARAGAGPGARAVVGGGAWCPGTGAGSGRGLESGAWSGGRSWRPGRGGAWPPGSGSGRGSGAGAWSGAGPSAQGAGSGRSLAPGAGRGARGSRCLRSAAAAGAEGTAGGRRAAGSRAARRQVKPGERVGGSFCPAVLSPGASGPPTGSGRPGRLRSIQGLAAEPGVCLFRAGAGRGARGLRREPAASPGRPHSETTLPSGPTLSCPYCYCLVASRPTVSPDSSFVLTRRTPVPQGVNPGSVGKLHLLAPFSSLPSLAGSLGLVTSTPRQAVFAGPPGLWDHRRRVLSERRQPLLGAGEKRRALGPTPDLRSGKLPLSRVTGCASRFEGRCRFSPDLVDVGSLCSALRLILPRLFASCLLLGWCCGDGQLCLGVRTTARDPARPGNSPQLWAWHKETLKQCLSSETELPAGRLPTCAADSPVSAADSRQPSGTWRATPLEATARGADAPAGGRALPTAAPAWKRGAGQVCQPCAASTAARESPRFFPSAAWRSCSGSTFLSVIVFLLQRGQRNGLGPAYRRHSFAHLRPSGLRLNSLLYWSRISKLLLDRLARGMAVTGAGELMEPRGR
uniref:Uncharacterized protein n=1 Tax=Rangifer tarandus platyrhynchus TaxID=3082113 RepID=A0ACB0F5X8_RANTA|nr:unnamed protein product [Rangifer tarandus platyrhynchus]